MELNKNNQENEQPLVEESGELPEEIRLVAKNQNSIVTPSSDYSTSVYDSHTIGAESTIQANPYRENWTKATRLTQIVLEGNYTQKSPMTNYLRAMVIASAFYYMGYYYGIMNPIGTVLAKKIFHMSTQEEIDAFNGNVDFYFCVACNVSSFLVGPLVNIFGRIRLLIIIEIAGIVLASLYLVEDLTVLYVTRGIDGILSGLIVGVCSISLSEMFPSKVTGFGGVFMYLSMTFFILLGWLTPLLFDNNEDVVAKNYKLIFTWPVGFGVIRLALLLLLFRFGALDSPGYFLNKFKTHIPEQRVQLELGLRNWYDTVYIPEDVESLVRDEIAKKEEQMGKDGPSVQAMFGPKYRFRFMIACVLNFLQQFTGISYLIFFSTNLFNQISHNGSTMTLVIGATNICGGILGLFTVEKFGRRFNLIWGCFIQGVGYALLIVGYKLSQDIISVVAVLSYVVSFAIGMGGTMPIFTAEILPAAGVGLALSLQWTGAWMTGKFLPVLSDKFGPVVLLAFFVVVNIFLGFFANYACVETKGITSDEVDIIYKGGETLDGKSHHFSWFRFGGGGEKEPSDDDE